MSINKPLLTATLLVKVYKLTIKFVLLLVLDITPTTATAG